MESKGEQFYPTYRFDLNNRDVVLIEFEEAQKVANSQTKIYAQVASVLVAITAVLIPLFFNQEKEALNANLTILQENSFLFALFITFLGGFLLRYFVELQRQIVFNARKVVSLRLMLGLDYGNIHLTLPNFRVEGATNPFVIKFFNGWFWFQTVPFWMLTFINILVWRFACNNSVLLDIIFSDKYSEITLILITLAGYIYIFRCQLFEQHENLLLVFTKNLSKIIRIKLLPNFEYIIYRAKLSYIELDRLNVNYKNLEKILVDIEDKSFHNNSGFSIKSLMRGFFSIFKMFRRQHSIIKNGGSTLTMQLARTLFIPSNQNVYLRKMIEILLSIWINKTFVKSDILKLYIASVRYEKGKMGLSFAIKHFFQNDIQNMKLTNEESFFLVERLSNISSTINWTRINHLLTRTQLPIERSLLDNIYNRLIREGKLRPI